MDRSFHGWRYKSTSHCLIIAVINNKNNYYRHHTSCGYKYLKTERYATKDNKANSFNVVMLQMQ